MAKVLIVDDDKSMLESLSDCLETGGHLIVACDDPTKAEALALAEKPDVAVVDYQMPGKSGTALLADLRAREETKKLPVIFLSGTETLRYSAEVPPEPRARFLRKPVQMEELLTLIAELLNPDGWANAG